MQWYISITARLCKLLGQLAMVAGGQQAAHFDAVACTVLYVRGPGGCCIVCYIVCYIVFYNVCYIAALLKAKKHCISTH